MKPESRFPLLHDEVQDVTTLMLRYASVYILNAFLAWILGKTARDQPMLAEYFPRARSCFPKAENMNGIGINRTLKNANVLDHHGMQSLWYIGAMNSGKAAAKADLKNVFAATALAAYRWNVSIR